MGSIPAHVLAKTGSIDPNQHPHFARRARGMATRHGTASLGLVGMVVVVSNAKQLLPCITPAALATLATLEKATPAALSRTRY
eukprot:scaffold1586_cov158-Amphora_coffeaeformis.AAC.5